MYASSVVPRSATLFLESSPKIRACAASVDMCGSGVPELFRWYTFVFAFTFILVYRIDWHFAVVCLVCTSLFRLVIRLDIARLSVVRGLTSLGY